jgi:hypothetical protein
MDRLFAVGCTTVGLLIAWGLLAESSKRICLWKAVFSRSYISSSVMYVRTLKPGASQYIANWSDIGWFFVGF